jgi:hypothetical protein
MSLPQQLDQVPADQRVPEALGIGFAGVGVAALIVFAAYAVQVAQHGLKGDAWKFLAGSAAVGVGGIVIEILRRKKPLVLVVQGDQIGAYKDGQLLHTFGKHQVTYYQLSFINTFREMMVFGVFGAFATMGALFMLRGPSLMTAWTWAVAIALDSVAYSSVLTRIMSRQYYLPAEVTPEALAFRKSDLQRVGWSQ